MIQNGFLQFYTLQRGLEKIGSIGVNIASYTYTLIQGNVPIKKLVLKQLDALKYM